jgi:Family of unknown function (DUF5999)
MSAAALRQPHRQPQHRACRHKPQCPAATAGNANAARVVDARPEEGWYLLCNGIVRRVDGVADDWANDRANDRADDWVDDRGGDRTGDRTGPARRVRPGDAG